MAYYDYNGTITIDEQAARRDIQKIRAAFPQLESARSAIDHLANAAEGTQGETGRSAWEKARELSGQINGLIRALHEVENMIDRTVRHYQQLDREVKAAIEAAAMVSE